MANSVPMTPEGVEKLRAELKQLAGLERIKIADQILVAREHGDLSENAEYHAAKEAQAHLEARIAYVEDLIARAEVIDPSKIDVDTVAFGANVKVLIEHTGKEIVYQIVGQEEADAKQRRISVNSPIGKALVGSSIGDAVEVQTPAGLRVYEVLDISYG